MRAPTARVYRSGMRVVFTKGPGTSYEVAVHREIGPQLAPRNGPGGHPYLPHDLVHFIVEVESGLRHGVLGQLAAGDNGLFWPADPAERSKASRRHRSKRGRSPVRVQADTARSEELVGIAVPLWESRRGLTHGLPAYVTAKPLPPEIDRIVTRLDDYADRWHALPVGGCLTVDW